MLEIWCGGLHPIPIIPAQKTVQMNVCEEKYRLCAIRFYMFL